MYPKLALLPDRLTVFPPSLLTSCRLHTFCVDGEESRIQSALDATFAAPSIGAARYQAIGAKLFVSVAEIGRLQSTDADEFPMGLDVGSRRHRVGHGSRRPSRWRFAGFRCGCSSTRLRRSSPAVNLWLSQADRAIRLHASGPGRADFPYRRFRAGHTCAGHQAAWSPLIEFTPSDAPSEPEAASPWQGLEDFANRVARRLRSTLSTIDSALANAMTEGLGLGKSTLAFLKQFPDAADPRLACYQAVIEADCEVRKIRSAGLTSRPYRANILSYASHPLNQQLGIAPGVKEVGHGVAVDFDFTLGLGREIWRAP